MDNENTLLSKTTKKVTSQVLVAKEDSKTTDSSSQPRDERYVSHTPLPLEGDRVQNTKTSQLPPLAQTSEDSNNTTDTDGGSVAAIESFHEKEENELLRSPVSTQSVNPDIDSATKQLSDLKVKHPKLTPAERRELVKARLQASGIAWDPSKYGKNKKSRPKSNQAAANTPSRKRDQPDSNTPPSAQTGRKKWRNEEGRAVATTSTAPPTGSYRGAVTNFKVAIVLADFPKVKLTEEQAMEVEGILADGLAAFTPPEGGEEPEFEGTYPEAGALIVSCTNESSKLWVTKFASSVKLQGQELPLVAGDKRDILKVTKILMRLPERLPKKPAEWICTQLERQNRTFQVADWKLLSSQLDGAKGAHMIFLVNDAALNAIKEAGFVAKLSLWKATIRAIPWRERGNSKDGGQNTANQPPPQ